MSSATTLFNGLCMNKIDQVIAVMQAERDSIKSMGPDSVGESEYSEVIIAAFNELGIRLDSAITVMLEMKETLILAEEFVEDVMPQAARLVFQDYANLNTLCMNMTELHKTIEEIKDGT
jgi:hypothetical protein